MLKFIIQNLIYKTFIPSLPHNHHDKRCGVVFQFLFQLLLM